MFEDVERINLNSNYFSRLKVEEQQQIIFAKSLIPIKKELIKDIGLENSEEASKYINEISIGTLLCLFFIENLPKYGSNNAKIGIGSIGYEFKPIFPSDVSSKYSWSNIEIDENTRGTIEKNIRKLKKVINKNGNDYTDFKGNFTNLTDYYFPNKGTPDNSCNDSTRLIITLISDLLHDRKAIETNTIEAEIKELAEACKNVELNIIKIPTFIKNHQSEEKLIEFFEKYFNNTPFSNEKLLDIATFQEKNYVDHLESILAPTIHEKEFLFFDYSKNDNKVTSTISFEKLISNTQDLVLKIKPINTSNTSNYRVEYKFKTGNTIHKEGILYPGISENIKPLSEHCILEITLRNFNPNSIPQFFLEFWTQPKPNRANNKLLVRTKFREKLEDDMYASIYWISLVTIALFIGIFFINLLHIILKSTLAKSPNQVENNKNGINLSRLNNSSNQVSNVENPASHNSLSNNLEIKQNGNGQDNMINNEPDDANLK